MKVERSGVLKPGKLGLSYKANKCSDVETGDLGVLKITNGDVDSTRPKYK